MDVVVDFLYEISFFGYEQKQLAKEIKKLDEAMKESEEHPERLERVDLDKMFEGSGIPVEEIYPEEREKEKAVHLAEFEYSEYCKMIELERIKQNTIEEFLGDENT